MLHAVIMAGGSGTRLWPESRRSRPKQFLAFEGDRPLIAATVDRIASLVPPARVLVVTGGPMRALVEEALPELPPTNILCEPAARNTAPCIGWAAVELLKRDPDATILVLPADHVIRPESEFCETLRFAVELIDENPERLLTLGIKPTFPSTSYGYIQRKEPLASPVAEKYARSTGAYTVAKFHEKPSPEKASAFLKSGGFNWNAGIFVWKAATILDLIRRFEPEMGRHLEAISASVEPSALAKHFPEMKKISIDYAVLERADSIVVLDATFSWDDVGTWRALDRLYADNADAAGNIGVGARVLAVGARSNTVRANDGDHLFALLGVEDLIVVQTENATLIARKDREESVREVIEHLKGNALDEYL